MYKQVYFITLKVITYTKNTKISLFFTVNGQSHYESLRSVLEVHNPRISRAGTLEGEPTEFGGLPTTNGRETGHSMASFVC